MSFEAKSLYSLQGLVAVVSGGGSGIGLMISTALETNGATVFILGRRESSLKSAIQNHSKHGRMFAVQGDVSDKDDLTRITKKIEESIGYVNMVFCNHGILEPLTNGCKEPDSLASMQEYLFKGFNAVEWNTQFMANVHSHFLMAVAFLGLLDKGNKVEKSLDNIGAYRSQIVFTTSAAAFTRNASLSIPYNLSKAAQQHLAKTMTTFLGPYNIRVNSMVPGAYLSEMTYPSRPSNPDGSTAGDDGHEFGSLGGHPLGRTGKNTEMAGAALWLASRSGGYANGLSLLVEGGGISFGPSTY